MSINGREVKVPSWITRAIEMLIPALIAIGASYAALRTEVQELKTMHTYRIEQLEKSESALVARVDLQAEASADMREAVAVMRDQLAAIREDLQYIKKAVRHD